VAGQGSGASAQRTRACLGVGKKPQAPTGKETCRSGTHGGGHARTEKRPNDSKDLKIMHNTVYA